MAVGDIYRFSIKGRYDGQAVFNTGHYRVTAEDAGTPWTATTMATAFRTWWQTTGLIALNVAYQFEAIDCTKILPTLGITGTAPVSATPGTGDVVGDGHPSYVAMVLSWRTNLGGRAYRGRWYLPGVAESGTLLSKITEPQYVKNHAIGSGMLALLASGATNRAEFGILSKRSTVVPENTFTKVTEFRVVHELCTMRSRMIGRGI